MTVAEELMVLRTREELVLSLLNIFNIKSKPFRGEHLGEVLMVILEDWKADA